MLVHYLLCTYLANPVTYVYAYSFDITFTKFATMHDNICCPSSINKFRIKDAVNMGLRKGYMRDNKIKSLMP